MPFITLNPYLAKSFILTSEARNIAFATDEPKLIVSLECNGTTFFNTTIYAYNGIVELFDPGDIIETYFTANNLICESITITFGTQSDNFIFIYCENEMPENFNPRNHPLISTTARRVHPGSMFTFAALPDGPNTPFIIKAVGHNIAGKIASVTFPIYQNINNTTYHDFDVDTIIATATGHNNGNSSTPQLINSPLKNVIYFSVEHGTRQLMCYITPATAFLTFRFRNIYNIPELADIEGTLVTKSKTSRKDAICYGNIINYDRKTDRTYELTTTPVPADEIETIQQLIASHTVQILADSSFHDIVIDDHTCDTSTTDADLSTIKFTWRFIGHRPHNFNSTIFGINTNDRKIFSQEYAPEYD